MKSYLSLVLCLSFVQIHAIQRPSRSIGKLYDQKMQQIDMQISRTNLTPDESTNLMTKLKNYFLAKENQPSIVSNTKIEVLYSSIIKSYQELLAKVRNSQPLKKQFQEQILGKIYMHR